MPGVVLEAGWLQRPVVATRVGGTSECIVNGRTGMLVERDDENRFAEVLSELLQRPDRMRELGSEAKKWVKEHFTTARIASIYEGFYLDVLSRRFSSNGSPAPRRATQPRREHSTVLPAVLE
jgi:glycosyltransferase involved in cell wall biosynthesis